MRVPAGLLFLRETRRAARRMRTMWLRLALAVIPLGLVLFVALGTADSTSVQSGAEGRQLFGGFTTFLLAAAVIVAPIAGAMGVQAEKQGGALDLLQLSNVSVHHVLDGVIGSRLAAVSLALGGAAPAMALGATLGGVSPWDVVALALGVVATTVYSGWYSAAAAVVAKNVMGPVVSTWMVLLLALGAGCCAAGLGDGWVPPHGAVVLAFALLMPLPGLLWVRRLAAKVLERAVYGDILDTDDPSWVLEVGRRRLVALLVVLAAAGAWGVVLVSGELSAMVTLGAVRWLVVVPAIVLSVAAVQGVTVETSVARLHARRPRTERDPSLQWRGGRARRVQAWLRATPIGNPVAWRELVTQAVGPTLPIVVLSALAWLALLLVVLFAGEQALDVAMYSSALMVGLSGISLPIIASSSWSSERRERTLELLLLTTLPVHRVVMGKAISLLARTLPLLVPLCIMAWAPPLLRLTTSPRPAFHVLLFTLGLVAVLLWFVALAGVTSVICARIRPARLMWIVSAGAVLVPLAATVFWSRDQGLLVGVASPVMNQLRCRELGLTGALISCAVWAVVGALAWTLLTLRLRRWVRDDTA